VIQEWGIPAGGENEGLEDPADPLILYLLVAASDCMTSDPFPEELVETVSTVADVVHFHSLRLGHQ